MTAVLAHGAIRETTKSWTHILPPRGGRNRCSHPVRWAVEHLNAWLRKNRGAVKQFYQRKVPRLTVSGKLFMNLVQHEHFHCETAAIAAFCFEAQVMYMHLISQEIKKIPRQFAPSYSRSLSQGSGSDSITVALRRGEVGIQVSVKDTWAGELTHKGRFNLTPAVSPHTPCCGLISINIII